MPTLHHRYAGPVDVPTGAETRQAYLWPLADTSMWNTPLGASANLGPVSTALAAVPGQLNYTTFNPVLNIGGVADAAFYLDEVRAGTWTPVVRTITVPHAPASIALAGDMDIATITYNADGSISFSNIPDGQFGILDVANDRFYEAYKACRNSVGDPRRVICRENTAKSWDLRGSGMWTEASGSRASRVPFTPGTIRKWEMDRLILDPSTAIRHVLAMAIPNGALLNPNVDIANGYPTPGFQWPANGFDGDGATNYSGSIRMGTMFALDPNYDFSSMSLEGQGLAYALRDYGAVVMDRSSLASLYAEKGVNATRALNLRAAWQILVDHMRPVLDHTALTPGGAGVRVRPLAPAFA